MGATIKLDLTSDVTHLIVGSINSAKYRYVAKSREDVKVVTPDWLDGMRQEWIKGGEVDVAAVEEQYRLPTFYGLKICLTGFGNGTGYSTRPTEPVLTECSGPAEVHPRDGGAEWR
jgi:hypothetical protein